MAASPASRTTSPRGPRGPYAAADEQRARIIEATVAHFAQHGFHASSLSRIASEAGITKSGLVHHFRTKQGLLVAVLERIDERDSESVFLSQDTDLTTHFLRLVELARLNGERPYRTRMFNMLLAEAGDPAHPAHAYFQRRYRRSLDDYSASQIQQAQQRGELHPDTDALGTAREIAAVMDGFQYQWALDPDHFDMPARLHTYLDRLLRALRTDRQGLPPYEPSA